MQHAAPTRNQTPMETPAEPKLAARVAVVAAKKEGKTENLTAPDDLLFELCDF